MSRRPKRDNLNLSLDRALLERVDRYWHKYMLPTRTAALRVLIERALDADDEVDDDKPVDKPPKPGA